jgi:hypothetical protein
MKIFYIFLVFLYSSQPQAEDLNRVGPHPSLTPEKVVKIIINSLKNNDQPRKNRGVTITFSFASPANKQNTGPLKHFNSMIRGKTYGPMINHRSAVYENYNVMNNRASIDVILVSSKGKTYGYRFKLSQQNKGKFKDSWMTDAVMPIQVTTL